MKSKYLILLFSIFFISFPLQAAIKDLPAEIALAQVAPGKINLNTADVQTLTGSFKGIGTKRAEAIVRYRENQKFENLEQLAEVKGIGKGFVTRNLEKLKEIFSVS